MRRFIAILLLLSPVAVRADLDAGGFPFTWNLFSGEYVANGSFVLSGGEYVWVGGTNAPTPPTPSNPYPQYASTVLLWEFANNTDPTADTSSGAANPGTLGSGAALPTFVAITNGISAHYSFDGADTITRTAANAVSTATAGTMAAWVKPSQVAASTSLMATSDDSVDTVHITLLQRVDKLAVSGRLGAGSDFIETTTPMVADVWQHCTATSDGSTWYLYMNGGATQAITVGSANSGRWFGDASGRDNFTVGYRKTATPSLYFSGDLDLPIVWDATLTQAENDDLFWLTCTNYGWSPFDANNRDQHSNTVIVSTFSYDSPADTSYYATNNGTKGAAAAAPTFDQGTYYFDGGDKIDYDLPINTAAWSFAAWIYRDTAGGWTAAHTHSNLAAWSTTEVMSMGGNDSITVALNDYGMSLVTSGTVPAISNWFHVVVTASWSPKGAYLYTNGYLAASDTTLTAMGYPAKMIVGKNGSGSGFMKGNMDDIRYYNVALSSNEAYNLYTDTTGIGGH